MFRRPPPASGSRTLVTKLTGSQSYRFFPAPSPQCHHAPPSQQCPLVAASPQQILPAGHNASGLLIAAPREYTWIAAACSDKRVLLPLLRSAPTRRLREDVRFETVLALVGKNVRETSYAYADRQFQRRPAVPSSRPLRTCQTLKAALNLKF